MVSEKRILIVTQELAPFTNGGIGVLTKRIVDNYQNNGHFVTVLCNFPRPNGVLGIDDPKLEFVGDRDLEDESDFLPQWAYSDSRFHAHSINLWRHIHSMLREFEFDFIEFPDYQGLAFSTIFGLREISSNTEVVIRVHSPDFLLRNYDFNPHGGLQKLWSHNLEIVSLLESDSIIVHSEAVGRHLVDALRNLVSDKGRLRIQEKIRLEELSFLKESRPDSTAQWNRERIIFASKIQELKNPELFVKASINYLRKNPDFTGEIVFTATVVDHEIYDALRKRIPHDIKNRFVFYDNLSTGDRQKLFQDSLVCIPSTHESLSLLSFEVLDAGGIPVLNSNCAAFVDGSVWIDQVNCIKFDGTAMSLSRALSGVSKTFSLKASPKNYVRLPDFYSLQQSRPPVDAGVDLPLTVVIAHLNMSTLLFETLVDTLNSIRLEDEILIVDDGSDFSQLEMVRDFKHLDSRIHVIELESNFGLPAARNFGISCAKNELILILDSDDFITKDFLDTSRKLLSKEISDVIVPQVAMFTNHLERVSGKFKDFAAFQGVGTLAGAFENRLGSATIMAKKQDLLEFKYNEAMNSFEDWDVLARLGCAGKKIHIYEKVGLHYRTRLNSMVRTDGATSREKNLFILRQNFFIPASTIKSLEDHKSLNVNFSNSTKTNNFILVKLAERRLVILKILVFLSSVPLFGSLSKYLYSKGRVLARKRGLNAVPIR
jgi:glycosyltransferase involved in cell wall biosynthesis